MRTNHVLGIAMVATIVIIGTILLLGAPNNTIPITTVKESNSTISYQQNPSSSTAGTISHSLILKTTNSSTVKQVLVYKDVPMRYTRDDIISLGQKFNISAPNHIKEGNDGVSIATNDSKIYAYLFNRGTIEFSNTNRIHSVNPLDVPGKLPSDGEAEKIASKFLRDRDLLPDGAVFIGTEHGKIIIHPKDGNEIVTWEDVQVWYGRELNGLKVKGTKISVDVGGDGDIIDFYSNWREYKPHQELPIKIPELAFEELKTKGVPVGMNSPNNVSINEVYLAYRSKPGAQMEYYLEPVWVFKGDVMVDGKSIKSVEQYIPALTDDAVKSLASS